MNGVLKHGRASRLFALVTTALVVAATVGWLAGGSSGSTAAKQKTWVIGYNPPTSLPFDVAMQKAMKLQAKKLGVKVVFAGGTFDPGGGPQLVGLNSLIDRHVDALIIFPINPKSQLPAVVRATKAGIKVVNIEPSPGLEKYYLTSIESNDQAAATQIAKYAGAQVGKPCKVGIIQGPPVVPVLNNRNIGYAAGAKAAGCEILDQQINQNDQPATATAIANTWKTKYGNDMNLILAYNDPTAFGALAAVSGSWQPKVTGMNGDEPNIQAVKDGKQLADGAVGFPELGNGILWAAVEALKGHKLPKLITHKIVIWTKANVDKYVTYNQRLTKPMDVKIAKEGGKYVLNATLPK